MSVWQINLRCLPFEPDPDNTGVGTGGKLSKYIF